MPTPPKPEEQEKRNFCTKTRTDTVHAPHGCANDHSGRCNSTPVQVGALESPTIETTPTPPLIKPPIGVPPRQIWINQRVTDLARAIYEYLNHKYFVANYKHNYSVANYKHPNEIDQNKLLEWIHELELMIHENV